MTQSALAGTGRCGCTLERHTPKLVVVTGGPGAGKTAVLELVRRHFCSHVVVLPEAASIVYGGGFPRTEGGPARRAAQRAIFHVEVELERMVTEEAAAAVALCDRGTVDGLAYWPGTPDEYWSQLGTTLERELARYAAVIHLRTPPRNHYNHVNPLRIESAELAARIDERIEAAWAKHPRRFIVASEHRFVGKADHALALVEAEVPACCAD